MPKKQSYLYSRNCDFCEQPYIGWGRHFCSVKCRAKARSQQTRKCKLETCNQKHEGRGFCKKHLTQLYRGTIDINGNLLKIKEIKKCKIDDCGDNVYVKDFCVKHYSQLQSNVIDVNGNRIPSRYVHDSSCKIKNCNNPFFAKGFCEFHYPQYHRGYLDIDGNIIGIFGNPIKHDKCILCEKPYLARGFCANHYQRYRLGYIDIDGNKLKTPNKCKLNPIYLLAGQRLSKQWSRDVKVRDNYICQQCGSTHNLQSHHILSRKEYPLFAFLISNGITLCQTCHKKTLKKPQKIKTTKQRIIII